MIDFARESQEKENSRN